MKKITTLVVTSCLLLFFITCKKSGNSNDTSNVTVDTLDETSDVVAAQLDKEPSVYTDLNDIILPNGSRLMDFELAYNRDWLLANIDLLPEKYKAMASGNREPSVFAGPQAAKNNIVAQVQITAWALTNKSNFTDLLKNSTLQKGQGLAYVYGAKDYNVLNKAADVTVRNKQTKKIETIKGCPELLHGIDCSGMLSYLMQKGGGIKITGNSTSQSLKGQWEDAIKKNTYLAGLKVTTFTSKTIKLTDAEIKSGDIIYFSESAMDVNTHAGVSHIGIALKDQNDKLVLYQSNGRQSATCEGNYKEGRGPRPIALNEPIAVWKFKDYGVLRLDADISGKWKAFIRCQDKTADAITLDLEFPATTGGDFKATGAGTDYTGEAINVEINGTYDIKTNVLKGTIVYTFPAYPDQKRSDAFESSLDYDATPYFNLTKVVDNGGCAVAMRLYNAQSREIKDERKSAGTKVKPDCVKCTIGRY